MVEILWYAGQLTGIRETELLDLKVIKFLNNREARESLLSKKIILLEREMLAHGVS
jgi:hypothetical protein